MLQGARHEHIEALQGAATELSIELEIVELRRGDQVDSTLDALVLPGGESTAMRKASESEALLPALYAWMDEHDSRPVLGTCAGAILLSAPDGDRPPYIAAPIARNAWGRQRQSFEAEVQVSLITPASGTTANHIVDTDQFNHRPLPVGPNAAPLRASGYPGVFIRAPRFETNSVQCEVVATLEQETVGVLDGRRLALTFHPELTLDRRFHRWLIANADRNPSEQP